MNENNEKINLANYTEEELSKLSPDQIQKLFFETLKEIVEVSQNITKKVLMNWINAEKKLNNQEIQIKQV